MVVLGSYSTATYALAATSVLKISLRAGALFLRKCKGKLYLIPKNQDLLLKLEGFQYAMTLDHNMGYCHIELSPFSSKCLSYSSALWQIQIPTSAYGSMQ
jgi:hypothetical protein